MTEILQSIIAEIHQAPHRLALAITGGGSAAISRLLGVPGASRTVLEAIVPYHPQSLAEYLGGDPDQACSAKTARAMAMAAFQRARRLDKETDQRFLLGLGATAALSTDRDRRGENRVFVSVQSLASTREASLVLAGGRTRAEEEALAATLIVDLLAEACGLPADLLLSQDSQDEFHEHVTAGKPEWQALLAGQLLSTAVATQPPQALFPGAFNPLHDGHRTMIRLARDLLDCPVSLEISAFNVDKPPLDYFDMAHREAVVGGEYPLVFTHAPTFVEKSALFPGIPFVVGVDTVKRIAQPRYYEDSELKCLRAIETIAERGNSFLVFGRRNDEVFETLDDLELPAPLRAICQGVEEAMFRHDISSSELRGS